MVAGIFVRSPHAHAKIKSIDTGAARAMPGVLAVFTGADLKTDGVNGPRPNTDKQQNSKKRLHVISPEGQQGRDPL